MGIDVNDLPPAYQAQALRKWAEQERKPDKQPPTGGDQEETGADDAPPPPPAGKTAEEKAEPERPAGKVMPFPVPTAYAPVEDAPEPEKERMSPRRAVLILEDLQMYCEEMMAIKSEQAEEWAERDDALMVALSIMRKQR